MHRAWEMERPDALFRDPFARKLAGERGEKIATKFSPGRKDAWSWVTRTYIVDRDIMDQVAQGADTVVNLAAGLDTRPYRMTLPASLRWVEVDLAGILDCKEEILADEKPVASLARDLAAVPSFTQWVCDIVSPGVKRIIEKRAGRDLHEAGAPFKFAPREGPGFFATCGWKPVAVRSLLKTAAQLGRLTFLFRLMALLPESSGRQGSRPWSGVCLLEKA